jgi:hypothetical protein
VLPRIVKTGIGLARAGETLVDGLAPGAYRLQVTSTCTRSITFHDG